jgi:hypothetical protein
MVRWCGPRGALIAPGMLPAEMERKRRQHGASCPGGTGSAAGWRFRVFFGDNRNAAPQPAENRQVQQDGQQAGKQSPGCISCPQTRRNNNHGCRVRKRLRYHKSRARIFNDEIGDRSVRDRKRTRARHRGGQAAQSLFQTVVHAERRSHRTTCRATGASGSTSTRSAAPPADAGANSKHLTREYNNPL